MIFETDSLIASVFAAFLVLVFGYLVGKLAKHAVIQIFEGTGIRQKMRFGIEREAGKYGFKIDLVYLVGLVLKYAIYLIAVFLALKVMRVEIAADAILLPLISYVPNIIGAIFILIVGSAIIELLADIIKYRLRDSLDEKAGEIGISSISTLIASYVRYFLYAVILITAVLQLGIKAEGLATLILFVGILVMVMFAAVLVFSVKDHVPNITAGLYLKENKVIEPGDLIRVGNVEGRLEKITLFATVVKGRDGRHYIPNSKITQGIFSVRKK